MNTTQIDSVKWSQIAASAIGILTALFIVAVLTDAEITFITDDRGAFIALAILGFIMCSIGMSFRISTYGWLNPVNITGTVLGILIVLLILAVLTGTSLPLIPDEQAGFTALAGIIFVKFVLASLRWLPQKSKAS